MRRSRLFVFMAALVLLSSFASGAHAGQVRINATGSFTFLPNSIALNQGDQVVWVWTGGGHTVESGAGSSDPGAGSLFLTNLQLTSGNAFSWKSTQTGSVPYYCVQHEFSGMTGSLTISASGIPVSNFRITELEYNQAGGLDRIEITNMGGDTGDLGRYRISVNGAPVQFVPLNSVTVFTGGRVTIHTNEAGTNTATNLFMGGLGDLPTAGSIALYVPNSATPVTGAGSGLTEVSQIIDFVQWGSGAQGNLATAMTALVWPTSGFLNAVPTGYDLVFCGTATQYGNTFWDVAHPNFSSGPLCSTPTRTSTWGRIKVLYR
jgi:plastocyanin